MTQQLTQRVDLLALEVEDISREQKELTESQQRIEGLVSNHLKAVAELSAEVHRLAVAVERSEWDETPQPRVPSFSNEGRSWHQQLRAKRVSPLTATAWSALIYAVTELVRAVADGRIHFH